MSRTWWRTGGSILAGFVFLLLAWEAVDQFASRIETRTDSFGSRDIRAIEIVVDDGSVLLVGQAETVETTVTATLRVGIVDPNFTSRVSDRTLFITASCGAMSDSCLRSLRVNAARGVDVQITSDNDDVEIRGVSGSVRVTAENGDIEARQLAGGVTMTTDNGDISADSLTSRSIEASSDNGDVLLEFSGAPQRVAADSDNGDVTVMLPKSSDRNGVDFALTATSDNGATSSPVRTNPSSDRSIRATSDNGDVTIAYQT